MSSNDITGARLVSRANDKNYEDGYDRIFRNKREQQIKDLFIMTKEMKNYEKSDAKILKEQCIKYEEANEVSNKIRNLIKDNEVDVIND